MIAETKCSESSGTDAENLVTDPAQKNEQRVTGRMRSMFPQVEVENAHGELRRVVFIERGRARGEVERESAEKSNAALMSVTASSVSVSDVLLFTLNTKSVVLSRPEDVDLDLK